MRPIRPKNSSPCRCLVVRPPFRPASARVIFSCCTEPPPCEAGLVEVRFRGYPQPDRAKQGLSVRHPARNRRLNASSCAADIPPEMKIETLLAHLVQMGGSDLHLKSGAPPVVRVDGALTALELPAVTAEEPEGFAGQLLPPMR